jgi:hypothetical protein
MKDNKSYLKQIAIGAAAINKPIAELKQYSSYAMEWGRKQFELINKYESGNPESLKKAIENTMLVMSIL